VPGFSGIRIHAGNVAETSILLKKVPLSSKIDLPEYFEVIS
jgi:hypothetical protein